MTGTNARNLWSALCSEVVGVDRNGDEVVRLTGLGITAFAAGLTVCPPRTTGERNAVAVWLRTMALAIEGEEDRR